jgi:AcrR family transcriptional regulator
MVADMVFMRCPVCRRRPRARRELGIANMSLYNYVPAKDQLVELMTDQLAGEYAYPATPAPDPRAAIADLASQARDIAGRHPWLAGLMQRPMPPGPNGLRYLDYFLGLLAGSRLDTGAKLEVIAIISGFAAMYGAMQAALPAEQAGTAGTMQQNAAQVQAFAQAAASGRYPNLAAALTVGGPPRSQDDIFASCIDRLIDLAEPRPQRPGDRTHGGSRLELCMLCDTGAEHPPSGLSVVLSCAHQGRAVTSAGESGIPF